MSTLRTFNLQHPESSNNNIQLAEGGGVSVTAGILTATNVSSTNVTTTNVTTTNVTTTEVTATNGTFSGNLNVGGVLSYEDVTNIDAVGVITARAGVHVTGGNVAVGHNNPSVNLHVKGSASNGQIYLGGTGAHSQIYADNDGVLILNADQGNSAANSYLGFNVDNSEKLRITSSGNIGIGSDSPATTLDVAGTVQFKNNGATLKIESVPGNNFTQVQFKNDGGSFYVGRENNSGNWFATGSNYASVLRSDGAYPLIFRVNGQNSLKIDTNGKVGIGIETPGQTLSVAGSSAGLGIYNTGTHHGNVYFYKDGTAKGWLKYRGDNDTLLIGNVTDSIHVATDGDVAVGGATPVDRLTVYHSSVGNPTGITIRNTEASSTYSHARLRLESQNNAAYAHLWADVANSALRLGYNGSSTVNIKSDGSLGVGIMDPSQAKFVAQTASGMSIAAVKDNTGASISLGGVTQPRILMEAGASASQFKLYTASGSSYSSAGWRQRLHVTDTNASVSSTGNGANGVGCFGIADNSPDSRALALSIGGGSGAYGLEDPRPLVYLQRSYGIGGGSSTDETTLEISAPGSYNSAGVVYGIKSRAQHNLNGSHYAGHFEAHGAQYSANGTSALYAKTTKLDTNGGGDVIAFRADASITQGIANNGAAIAGYFSSGNNINGKPIVCLNGLTSNNWANQIIFRKHNGSSIVDVGSIKSSNTATQYNTSSDYRLKENVISLTGAIDRLKQLQPKRFNFIGVDETIDGFIAHEVTSVAPYAVSGEKDAVKKELVLDENDKEQFDENGEIIHREVIDPQGVDYGKLVTLTIAALQEAITKIETLETQLTDALARITALEG